MTQPTECPICGADVYSQPPQHPSWLWHLENEDCRAIRTPVIVARATGETE